MIRADAALFVLLALGACIPDHSPVMRPGEDCRRCHNGQRASNWNAAGTVFGDPNASVDQGVQGVTVTVTDSTGRSIALESNGAGNFYTAEGLTAPFTAVVDRNGQQLAMTTQNPGGCNSCHTQPPLNGAPGRIYAP